MRLAPVGNDHVSADQWLTDVRKRNYEEFVTSSRSSSNIGWPVMTFHVAIRIVSGCERLECRIPGMTSQVSDLIWPENNGICKSCQIDVPGSPENSKSFRPLVPKLFKKNLGGLFPVRFFFWSLVTFFATTVQHCVLLIQVLGCLSGYPVFESGYWVAFLATQWPEECLRLSACSASPPSE